MRKKDLIPHNFLSHNLHYEKFSDGTVKCIEYEIPFELPVGWEWTRLGCITDVIQYGLSNSAESTGDYRLLRITDIQNGCVNWDTVPFTSTDEPEKYLLHKDDIVFARTGATVGKSFLITDLPYASVYASYLIRIRLINGISANYIYHFFNSYCYWEQVTDKAVGVGQPNCNGTALRELFIPLPSQAEQNRIVPVADNLLKIVDTITSEQESLSELIQTTKSKILDLAIRGKLLPQDPNDEPASVPLERIRAEKEGLIKQGKIKRDKKDSVIFKGDDNSYYEKIGNDVICIDDEIPFDIPNTWSWTRISTIADITMGSSPKSQDICKDNQYIEFHQGKIYFSKKTLMKSNQYTRKTTKLAPKQSVLLCVRAPVGALNITDRDICIGRGLASIKSLGNINEEFIFYWLHPYKAYLVNQSTGSTFSAITSDTVRNILIPLPPLMEQKEILNKIQKVFTLLEDLETVN